MLNIHRFGIYLGLYGCINPLSVIALQEDNKKPNVLFILADDLGWSDLSCYGSTYYETPNIDQLFNEGILFTDAYSTAPVSSPSRISLQTGRYPVRSGITDVLLGRYYYQKKLIDSICPVIPPSYPVDLPLEEITIAEEMKKAGYETFFLGKWHCSEDSLYYPQYQGYDINFGGSNKGDVGKNGYISPYNIPGIKAKYEGQYLTDRITEEALNLLKENDKPFFMFLSYYLVHTPLQAKEEKIKYYQEKGQKMGLNNRQVYIQKPDWWYKQPFSNDYKDRIIQSDPVYAAMISIMDDNIGMLIQALKEKGLYENTIIIFTSDNGGLSTSESSPTSNRPLKAGKGHLYEGGIRVPLIIKNDQIENKIYSHHPVSFIDLFPTILELAGVESFHQPLIDGISLAPIILQKGYKPISRALYWHFPHYPNHGGRPAGAIREGDYKLIEFYDSGEIELYHLTDDIGENKNLINNQPEVASELYMQLQEWRKLVNAEMPLKNENHVK